MKYEDKECIDRIVYFDYLRVLATIAVIILHVSSQNWYTTDVNGYDWKIYNFYNSIVRWGVPVFVMISGGIFLERDIPLHKIYTKYISRMIISFVIWSAVYAFFEKGMTKNKIVAFLNGHYHMWFILMIVGLYMCVPIIKGIVERNNRTRYFLVLAFIFAFVVPEIFMLANDFGNGLVVKLTDILNKHFDNMNMQIVLGFSAFFVLGYYLNKITLNKRQRMLIYILGGIGFASTVGLDLWVALRTQKYCANYYNNFTVNVLFEALAVFTWFKYKEYSNWKLNAIFKVLSKYSFGAYLIHVLVIDQFKIRVGLTTLSYNSALSVIGNSMMVCIISFGISAVLNQIPIVKKYIV